jgi:hypothetical protein
MSKIEWFIWVFAAWTGHAVVPKMNFHPSLE